MMEPQAQMFTALLFFQSLELILKFPLSPLLAQEGKGWDGDINEFLLLSHSTRTTCVHCGSRVPFLFPTTPPCVDSPDTQNLVGISGALHNNMGQIWRERDAPSYGKPKSW